MILTKGEFGFSKRDHRFAITLLMAALSFFLSIFFKAESAFGQASGNFWKNSCDPTTANNFSLYPNGFVNRAIPVGNEVILSGSFSGFGSYVGYGYSSDPSTGAPLPVSEKINGKVVASTPDGAGGWYIAGQFQRIGVTPVSHFARISANGTFQSSVLAPNVVCPEMGLVRTIAAAGSILYVGGAFQSICGVPRNGLAGISLVTGQVLSWNPNLGANSEVKTLKVDSNKLYAGGSISEVQGTMTAGLLIFDSTAGGLLESSMGVFPGPWTSSSVSDIQIDNSRVYLAGSFSSAGKVSPYANVLDSGLNVLNTEFPNGEVKVVVKDGSTGWYIGGSFTKVGATTRNRIARYDSNGTLNSWTVNVDGKINTMELDGTTLYIGGEFSNVNGVGRSGLAAIDTATATLTSWNPSPNGTRIYKLAVLTNSVFVSGDFSEIGGVARYKIADIDKSTGQASAFNFTVDGNWTADFNRVAAITAEGTKAYIGGGFQYVGQTTGGGVPVDASSGSISAGSLAEVNGDVYTSLPDGSGGWYIGGAFTKVGSSSRSRIARINSDGSLNSWTSSANGPVYSLASDGTNILVGGEFTSLAGQSRKNLGSISIATGVATSWAPAIDDGVVHRILIGSTKIYVGGSFTSIGSSPRVMLAEFDKSTGVLSSWAPLASNSSNSGEIRSLFLDGSNLYVGGSFCTNLDRCNAMAYNTATYQLLPWNPQPSNAIYSISKRGSNILIGGHFQYLGSTNRAALSEVDPTTGAATGWAPLLDWFTQVQVRDILISGSIIYVVGYFNRADYNDRYSAAAFDASNGSLLGWNPLPVGRVNTVSESSGKIYLGGNFRAVNGAKRRFSAAFETANNTLLSWGPLVTTFCERDFVSAIERKGTDIYLGGTFLRMAWTPRGGLAVVDTGGNLSGWSPQLVDTNWCSYPMDMDTVSDFDFDGTNTLIAGSFSMVNNVSKPNLASLDSAGNLTSWSPSPILGKVNSLAINGGPILIGGTFVTSGTSGQPRDSLAAIDKSTYGLLSWNPTLGVGSAVEQLQLCGSNIYVGGSFAAAGGSPRSNVAAFDAAGAVTSFQADTNFSITAMAVIGNTLYFSGPTWWVAPTVNGVSRPTGSARIDCATSVLQSWEADQSGGGKLSVSNSALFVSTGDNFLSSSVPRYRLASIDRSTLALTSWDPQPDQSVNSLLLDGNKLFVGGDFQSISGTSRKLLAVYDMPSKALTSFDPGIDYQGSEAVMDMVSFGNSVYVGGLFSNVAGQPRTGLFAIDKVTGALLGSFNPQFNSWGMVYRLYPEADNLYLRGSFSSIDGVPRNNLASWNLTTNTLNSWAPVTNSGGSIYDIAAKNGKVFVVGDFTVVDGVPRNNIARYDAATGLIDSWSAPSFDGEINSISILGDYVYLSGYFDNVGATPRKGFAVLRASDGALSPVQRVFSTNGSYHYALRSAFPIGGSILFSGAFNVVDQTNSPWVFGACSTNY